MMRIVGSTVKMVGSQKKLEEYSRREEVEIWNNGQSNSRNNVHRDSLDLSAEVRKILSAQSKEDVKNDEIKIELSDEDKQNVLVLMAFIKTLTGKEMKINFLGTLVDPSGEEISLANEDFTGNDNSFGWGIAVDIQEIYHEQEEMRFSAKGALMTADGRKISFSIDMKLERSFRRETNFSFRAGDAPMKDPLVVNFAGGDAGIKGAGFEFSEGGPLTFLPYLAAGSGYLALDRNENGEIDQADELFGPNSGDGFSELATLDEDGNGWIDEGDAVFDKLRIWIKTEGGQEQLLTLKQVGISAILVEGLDLEYTYKDNANESVARNRAMGIFVREDGSAGTVQQIDVKA